MSQSFIRVAPVAERGGAVATGKSISDVMAADLTNLNKRDVFNTLEFASHHANAVVPEDPASSLWFYTYISAIINLGWVAQATGAEVVDLEKIKGAKTVADLIAEITSADRTTERRPTLGGLELFNYSGPFAGMIFSVTDVCLKNGLLTMQIVGLEFQHTKDVSSSSQFSSSERVRREIVDFTPDQAFLDENREEVEEKLKNIIKEIIGDTSLE